VTKVSRPNPRSRRELAIGRIELRLQRRVRKLGVIVLRQFGERHRFDPLGVGTVLQQPFQKHVADPLLRVRPVLVQVFADDSEAVVDHCNASGLHRLQAPNALVHAVF
jgi:hypothetical protein